mmetsp:Transcript_14251/g.26636  ORF Transcript_14251/g.26636 Transcript_14251/m.26636 type:complete len:95 (-) Transcript_14251:6-290(-)
MNTARGALFEYPLTIKVRAVIFLLITHMCKGCNGCQLRTFACQMDLLHSIPSLVGLGLAKSNGVMVLFGRDLIELSLLVCQFVRFWFSFSETCI